MPVSHSTIITVYFTTIMVDKAYKYIQEGWLPPTKRASAAKIN